MSAVLAALEHARDARNRGEYTEALRMNQAIHDSPYPDDHSELSFRRFALFELSVLADLYPPALLAMRQLRDREAAQLDSDPEHCFATVVELNRHLGEPRATLAAFLQLETHAPETARRMFHSAADVLLECGAAQVLQRYLPEPEAGVRYRAEYLNGIVRELAADERGGSVARRLGETQAFVNDLQLQCGVLKLVGRAEEAGTLGSMALSLIESEETRELARKELAEPGAISALMSDWHDAQRAKG